MDNLFEQAAMITKAHGYDILATRVKELKETMRELIKIAQLQEEGIADPEEAKQFETILKKAKILSL